MLQHSACCTRLSADRGFGPVPRVDEPLHMRLLPELRHTEPAEPAPRYTTAGGTICDSGVSRLPTQLQAGRFDGPRPLWPAHVDDAASADSLTACTARRRTAQKSARLCTLRLPCGPLGALRAFFACVACVRDRCSKLPCSAGEAHPHPHRQAGMANMQEALSRRLQAAEAEVSRKERWVGI